MSPLSYHSRVANLKSDSTYLSAVTAAEAVSNLPKLG